MPVEPGGNKCRLPIGVRVIVTHIPLLPGTLSGELNSLWAKSAVKQRQLLPQRKAFRVSLSSSFYMKMQSGCGEPRPTAAQALIPLASVRHAHAHSTVVVQEQLPPALVTTEMKLLCFLSATTG